MDIQTGVAGVQHRRIVENCIDRVFLYFCEDFVVHGRTFIFIDGMYGFIEQLVDFRVEAEAP